MAKRDLDVNISGDAKDLERAIALAQGKLGKFESDARKANRAVSQLERELATGQKAIAAAERNIAKAERDAEAAHARRMHAMSEVGTGLVAAGGAVALGIGLIVKRSMEFDKAMSSVGAAANASGGRLEALRKAAIKAGADTQYSATEAAKAEEELAKAGVSTRDILGGGLKGALNLAAAGQISVADAAETAASAMTQFGLKGKDVPHIADLLSAAANKAQGGVSDMSFALKQSGLVAAQFGLSVEDTTGTLAAFASAGLIGQDAGTSFKQMLLSLANPSNKAADLMKDLGISAYDAQGNFVGITKFAGILHDKLAKLTPQQRQSALATIFGSDAIRSATILYNQGAKGIQGWIGKVNDQGNAARTAAAKTDNLAGDVERLKGSLETAAIGAGSGLNGVLRGLVKGADAAVDAFNGLPGPVQTGVVAVSGIAGAASLAVGGLLILIPKVVQAREALTTLRSEGYLTNAQLAKTAKGVGLAAAAFAATYGIGKFIEAQHGAVQSSGDLQNALVKLGQTGRASGAFMEQFKAGALSGKTSLEEFGYAAQQVANPGFWDYFSHAMSAAFSIIPGIGDDFEEMKNKLKVTDQTLTQMVQSGQAPAAAAAYQRLAAAMRQAGVPADKIAKVLPNYTAAAAKSQSGSNTAATGVKNLGGKVQATAGQVDNLTHELRSYFNEVRGDATTANIQFHQSIADLNKALRENGPALGVNTQKGRDNYKAFLDAAQAANDHAQKVYKETGSVQAANKTLRSHVGQLRAVLAEGGLTKKQIDKLINTYLKVPSKASTKVSAPGATTARNQVKNLGKAITNIHGKSVTINANTKNARTQIGAFYRWYSSLDFKRTATIGFQQLGPGRQGLPLGVRPHADGGITRFAAGSEKHVAQIARPGDMRLWAEPETQGEAYIPLAPSKRGRSTKILGAVAAEFGYALVKEAAGAVRGATAVKKPAAKPAGGPNAAQSVAGLASALPDFTAAAAGTVKGSTQAATGLELLNTQAQLGQAHFMLLTGQAKTWGTLAAGPASTQTAALNAHVATLSNTVARNSVTTTANTARRNSSRAATVATSAATATHTARVRTDTATLQRANGVLSTNASRVRQVGREAITSGKHVDHFVNEYVRKPWKITRHIAVDASGKFTMKGFKGFATGGQVSGPGGPTEDKIPALLSDNEHVWTAREVRGAGGHANVERLRAAAANGDLPRFAKGGAVTRTIPTEGVKPFTPDYTKMMNRVVTAAIKTTAAESAKIMKSLLGGGGTAADMRALAWAKTQVGKPYQYGGNGNPSWDCSGFMSAIESVIRGQKPHRRWATTAFHGSTAPAGWKYHLKAPFMVGIHGGAGPNGHTAGTLLGHRVESSGSHGVQVDGPARGYNSSYFGNQWYGFIPSIGRGGGGSTAGGRHASPAAARAYAYGNLGNFGWSPGYNEGPLNSLWSHESSWRWNAANPSGAYGIPQAKPGSKMRSAGADWRDNAYTQINWGLGYIRDRYGSPAKAWRFWQSHHWYDDGGVAKGRGLLPKATLQPERVLSPRQTAAFEQLTATLTRISLPRTPIRAQGGDGAAIATAVSDAIRRMPRGDQYTMQLPEGVSAGQMAREITSKERRRRRGGLYA